MLIFSRRNFSTGINMKVIRNQFSAQQNTTNAFLMGKIQRLLLSCLRSIYFVTRIFLYFIFIQSYTLLLINIANVVFEGTIFFLPTLIRIVWPKNLIRMANRIIVIKHFCWIQATYINIFQSLVTIFIEDFIQFDLFIF